MFITSKGLKPNLIFFTLFFQSRKNFPTFQIKLPQDAEFTPLRNIIQYGRRLYLISIFIKIFSPFSE